MLALLQRVSEARVEIASRTVGEIGPGLLVASGAPMSCGCRKPCERMKKRTQYRYTFSVLRP